MTAVHVGLVSERPYPQSHEDTPKSSGVSAVESPDGNPPESFLGARNPAEGDRPQTAAEQPGSVMGYLLADTFD